MPDEFNSIKIVNKVLYREIRRVKKIMIDFPRPHRVNLDHVIDEYGLIRAEIVKALRAANGRS
jgi:hypothetical protein